MNLSYAERRLQLDGVDLDELVAKWGTPLYVYSANELEARYRAYSDALRGTDSRVLYAE